jgi:hypothetical protein
MIFDDLVSRLNITNPEQLQKVITFYKDSLAQLDGNGRMVIVGTRWHKMDLYGYILKNLAKEFQLKIVRKVKEEGEYIYPKLSPTWPCGFDDERCINLKKEMGGYLYSCQYENSPRDEKSSQFKEETFRRYKELRKGRSYNCWILVDPAISKQKGRHNSGVIVQLVDEDKNVYVDAMTRAQLNPAELISQIFEYYADYSGRLYVLNTEVGIETIGFQEMLVTACEARMEKDKLFFGIEELAPRGISKIDRIKGLIPFYEQGKVWHREGQCELLEEELLWLGEGSHPDIADAHAYGVKLWIAPGVSSEEKEQEQGNWFKQAMEGGIGAGPHWYETGGR